MFSELQLKYGISALREKFPYWEFCWSVFSRIRTEYGEILRIQSKCGKIKTRKTPNMDTFHAVSSSFIESTKRGGEKFIHKFLKG